ncbi:fimbrial biogenesis chaperone [Serratia rubidaea]|uniref:fimbrial biogenesis chaperone n=1 Tax=Serratia rubidaea TaxID=61652 RepID=UPI003FA3D5E3
MMMKSLTFCFCALFSLAGDACAGVIVESSRVVFAGGDRERALLLVNGNDYPVVVQTWVDDGAPDGTPETAGEVPVMPLPGIFRLEPGEKKNLRLLATQAAQPADRESLYWLNVYEIPPTDARLPPSVSALKVAVRLQLKLFYRPDGLQKKAARLAANQRFSLARQPGRLMLTVSNPTPLYATYGQAQLNGGGRQTALAIGMLAPFASKTLDVDERSIGRPESVSYMLIDDDGQGVTGSAVLKP